MEEDNIFYMPESTEGEIIDKMIEMAMSIRNDWQDPREECRQILRLCKLLKNKVKEPEKSFGERVVKRFYDSVWEISEGASEKLKQIINEELEKEKSNGKDQS